MTTITFDTYKFIQKLKAAGLPEQQAQAISDAFRDAQSEAQLATKHDIENLRRDMRELEQRMTIKLGGMLIIAISIVAALVKLL